MFCVCFNFHLRKLPKCPFQTNTSAAKQGRNPVPQQISDITTLFSLNNVLYYPPFHAYSPSKTFSQSQFLNVFLSSITQVQPQCFRPPSPNWLHTFEESRCCSWLPELCSELWDTPPPADDVGQALGQARTRLLHLEGARQEVVERAVAHRHHCAGQADNVVWHAEVRRGQVN